jgi:adenosine deaminase CECR1
MRKYLTYILMLGFPLLGAQTKVAEKAAYQEKWTSLDKKMQQWPLMQM